MVVPSPKAAELISPQHQTVSSARAGRRRASPHGEVDHHIKPHDPHGVEREIRVPSPMAPLMFEPQHQTLPSRRRAHATVLRLRSNHLRQARLRRGPPGWSPYHPRDRIPIVGPRITVPMRRRIAQTKPLPRSSPRCRRGPRPASASTDVRRRPVSRFPGCPTPTARRPVASHAPEWLPPTATPTTSRSPTRRGVPLGRGAISELAEVVPSPATHGTSPGTAHMWLDAALPQRDAGQTDDRR